MKFSFFFIVISLFHYQLFCQAVEDFEDEISGTNPGQFDPIWIGDTQSFILIEDNGSKQLRTNVGDLDDDSTYYIAIPSLAIHEASWEFQINLDFATSGVNYVDVFLVSDNLDLSQTNNGYFVRIGDTEDWVALHKIVNGKQTEDDRPLIATEEKFLEEGVPMSIKVTRDAEAKWELFIDKGIAGAFLSIGDTIDSEVIKSAGFGILVQQSSASSPANSHFFDDFEISGAIVPDTQAPQLDSLIVKSATELILYFNEEIDRTTIEDLTNYEMNGEVEVLSATKNDSDSTEILLTIDALTNGSHYTLSINNLKDLNENSIEDIVTAFLYLHLEPANYQDVMVNEFYANPDEESQLPEAEYIEVLNVSNKYLDLTGWTLHDANGSSGAFPTDTLSPGEYLVLTSTTNESLFSSFEVVLPVSNFPSFNNNGDDIVLFDNEGKVIFQITYTESKAGISTELINPADPCLSILTYDFSTSEIGGTPGEQNAIFDDSKDVISPTVLSYGFNNNELVITFSEVIDVDGLGPENFQVTGANIDSILSEAERPVEVHLKLDKIAPGIYYEMTMAGIHDCSGNMLDAEPIQFGIGRSPLFNEVIITEILVDIDPSVGLPEREFIEIYNATEEILITDGLILNDATASVEIPPTTLLPNTYYLLSNTTGAVEFGGRAIGVPNFPTLNNSGEQLLLSKDDTLIFSLTYDPEWHQEDKRAGGYSLEMIDVTNPCLESAANWGSSQSVEGGTPGAVNSINSFGSVPDNFGPELISVIAITSDTIRLAFDEKLHPSSIGDITIEINPPKRVNGVLFDYKRSNELTIILGESLEPSEVMEISVSGIYDCNGNEVDEAIFEWVFPEQAAEGDLILNEILFNPKEGGVDFVEIYNNSEKYLGLKEWQLAVISESGNYRIEIITTDDVILPPHEFIAITTDIEVLLSHYPDTKSKLLFQMNDMPNLTSQAGSVILFDNDSIEYENFRYEESYHSNLLESVKGVSLERVSFDFETNDPNNWRSAASTVGFATPGYENSQSLSTNNQEGKITINPRVFIPGSAGFGQDFTTINYELNQPDQFGNVRVYDQNGRVIKELANGISLGKSGFIRWDGNTDSGGLARLGYYLVLFEIYDALGNKEIIRETVVVGRNF